MNGCQASWLATFLTFYGPFDDSESGNKGDKKKLKLRLFRSTRRGKAPSIVAPQGRAGKRVGLRGPYYISVAPFLLIRSFIIARLTSPCHRPAAAPTLIAAVPEHKRLELMEQVRSGTITIQQMDAQLAYLGKLKLWHRSRLISLELDFRGTQRLAFSVESSPSTGAGTGASPD